MKIFRNTRIHVSLNKIAIDGLEPNKTISIHIILFGNFFFFVFTPHIQSFVKFTNPIFIIHQ